MQPIRIIRRAYENAFRAWRRPPIVAIELTNRCNADCTMCWRNEVKREHSDIEFEDFKRIANKTGDEGARIFQLSFFGESTLYARLAEAVAYLKSRYHDSAVVLNTNAACLDEHLAMQLLDADIDQIRISIDGNNPHDYEAIRRGLHFSMVRENVIRLWRLIQERSAVTQILIQGLMLKDYRLDAQIYHQTWSPFAHKIAIREEHDLIAHKPEPLLHKMMPCPKMFSQSIIMVNGDVCLCAYDWHGQIVLGNAIREPIKKIWNSATLFRYRCFHLLGFKRSLPLCKRCTYQAIPY